MTRTQPIMKKTYMTQKKIEVSVAWFKKLVELAERAQEVVEHQQIEVPLAVGMLISFAVSLKIKDK